MFSGWTNVSSMYSIVSMGRCSFCKPTTPPPTDMVQQLQSFHGSSGPRRELPGWASTRKVKPGRYKKAVLSQRSRCTFVAQYWNQYDPAIKVRFSDVNKGAWQIPCWNYGLRPGLPLVSPKFLNASVGGWPLGYEERRGWANCSCN